jgi:hypothetical protein
MMIAVGTTSCSRENHGHLTANQIGRQCGQSIELVLSPAIFDRHIAALDVASFAQALAEWLTREDTRSPAAPAAARALRAAMPQRRREA